VNIFKTIHRILIQLPFCCQKKSWNKTTKKKLIFHLSMILTRYSISASNSIFRHSSTTSFFHLPTTIKILHTQTKSYHNTTTPMSHKYDPNKPIKVSIKKKKQNGISLSPPSLVPRTKTSPRFRQRTHE